MKINEVSVRDIKSAITQSTKDAFDSYYQEMKDAVEQCPYYFAYGMNTNSRHMTDGDEHPMFQNIGTGTIHGVQLEFKVHCDIVRTAGARCMGVMWKMNPRGLIYLDQREGYPYYYNREIVPVQGNSKTNRAWVYYMTDDYEQKLRPPQKGYWQSCLNGYMEFGLPTEQLQAALERTQQSKS